jgi:uncharacterized protein YfiM (DUF2279 family)
MKALGALAACLLLAACTTTQVKVVGQDALQTPASDSKGLLIQPDVRLGVLTAAGMQEARADWSQDAQRYLGMALRDNLAARGHPFEMLDPEASMEGRAGQLLRLHEAVGASIQQFEYSGLRLPTKPKDRFDWTLGDGALVLRDKHGADYALFVTGRGTYSSAGRKALWLGAAMLGVSVPLGSQQVYASLVDLRTGQVIWYNIAVVGPQADIRTADGARALVQDLMKKAPI